MINDARQINLVGTVAVAVVALVGTALVAVPLFSTAQQTSIQAAASAVSDNATRARLAALAAQVQLREESRNDLLVARSQIPVADELQDASALASAAAKSAGARIVSITFAGRQVFTPPAGAGMAEDGTAAAAQVPAVLETPWVQLPVSFEVEVSSTAQAAAFLDGLRAGPRILQIVQAQSSATNSAKLSTVTVDALIFSAKR